jgi:hypothetical protein
MREKHGPQTSALRSGSRVDFPLLFKLFGIISGLGLAVIPS